jgi:hypothetical protein
MKKKNTVKDPTTTEIPKHPNNKSTRRSMKESTSILEGVDLVGWAKFEKEIPSYFSYENCSSRCV